MAFPVRILVLGPHDYWSEKGAAGFKP
jgi:hypothetical protein